MIAEEGKAGRKIGETWSAILVPSPAASNRRGLKMSFPVSPHTTLSSCPEYVSRALYRLTFDLPTLVLRSKVDWLHEPYALAAIPWLNHDAKPSVCHAMSLPKRDR